MESFEQIWELICEYCKKGVSETSYNTWFVRLKPVSLDFESKKAVIETPSPFIKNTVDTFYLKILNDAFFNIFGENINCEIIVKSEQKEKPEEKKEIDVNNTYNEYYTLTFETFIVGPSNNFAHAACVAVATKPAQIYNPLFIYGNSGLGKTHLLNAISSEISKNNPNLLIVYVKGEEFTNELIEAIQKGTTDAFRQKYRKADVLLMDDIQFIGGKDSTQEEFFHTFNTLFEARKQIILASDRPPKDIATLEERLKSRFESGLTADVQPPNFETRIAIIKRKAELLNINLPDNVSEFIATKLKTNIRQLEGVVKKIKAYHLLEKKAPSIVTAQNAISDIFKDDEPTPVTVNKIIEEVSRTFGCTKEDLLSSKRHAKVSNARQICAYIIREITQMPMASIGEILGGRDHSTMVYQIQKIEEKFEEEKNLKNTVDDIIKNIKSI